MAGKVTSLRFQKHTSDRANVYLDGKFAFGLPTLEAAKLHIGQYLSDADIEQLHALDADQKAYDRAVRFLGYRPRSEAEVRRNLVEAGVDEATIEQVIQRLVQQGYLDDVEFARFWVEERQRFRPRSARALRQELHQKGLDDSAIEAAVADVDAVTAAYAAARPRALRLSALVGTDPIAFRHKLSGFLLGRGFDYDVIREVVNQLLDELRG